MNNDDLKSLFPRPDKPEAPHVTLAQEWETSARYLRSSPLTVAAAAFAAFTLACDYTQADYLATFLDFLEANPELPGHRDHSRLPARYRYTDRNTDGDK